MWNLEHLNYELRDAKKELEDAEEKRLKALGKIDLITELIEREKNIRKLEEDDE